MGTTPFEQGDLLKIERISAPVLVVSKNFFNRSEQAICCPIVKTSSPDPLHIKIMTEEIQGTVLCEQMKFIDLSVRGYKKIDSLRIEAILDITDAIQSIFDYY